MSDVLGFHRRPSSGRLDIGKGLEWLRGQPRDRTIGPQRLDGVDQFAASRSRDQAGEPHLALALTICIAGSAAIYGLVWALLSAVLN